MSCAEVLEDTKRLVAFSESVLITIAITYFKDSHDSKWCKFHSKRNDDGSRYTTKYSLVCPVQPEAL